MSLTGWATIWVAIALCLATVASTALVWNKVQHRPYRWPVRVGAIVVCQLMAVLVAGVLFNDHYGFYTSWREPLGMEVHTVRIPVTRPGADDATLQPRIEQAAQSGRGAIVSIEIPGLASGVAPHQALVYLPPQYGEPSYARRTFPVVELIAGAGGGPKTWLSQLHVGAVLDSGLLAGTAVPMIAVMPTVTVVPPRDTECVNVTNGPQVETYLVQDVRTAVLRDFRASPQASGWSMAGYSTGGYCASNLVLRNPDMFSAGVSMSGYDKPYLDSTTGALFDHNLTTQNLNTPLWRVEHLPHPAVRLLLMTSKDDPESWRDSDALAAAGGPPLFIAEMTLRSAGHNFEVWRAEEPTAFAWLSRALSPPLAPVPTVDGVTPVPSG